MLDDEHVCVEGMILRSKIVVELFVEIQILDDTS